MFSQFANLAHKHIYHRLLQRSEQEVVLCCLILHDSATA